MYARTTTWRGNPQAVDEAIAYARDEAMPLVTALPGSLGMSMMCDRESGRCIVATSWQSEEALRASAGRVGASRDRAGEILGDPSPEVQEWEIGAMHRRREAPAGACCRVTWSRGDPAATEQMLETFRTGVVPRVDELPGFCSASLLVDRATGRSVLAATYESLDKLREASGAAQQLRGRFAGEQGLEVVEIAEMELAVAHLRVPETV